MSKVHLFKAWEGQGESEGLTVTDLEVAAITTWARLLGERYASLPSPDDGDRYAATLFSSVANQDEETTAGQVMAAKAHARMNDQPYAVIETIRIEDL